MYGFGNYDLRPTVAIPGAPGGWSGAGVFDEIAARTAAERSVTVVDCYPGVDVEALVAVLAARFPDRRVLNVEEAARSMAEIDARIEPHLTDDRVFGVLAHIGLGEFYDEAALAAISGEVEGRDGPVVLVGWGASLAAPEPDLLVLADLPRWEAQLRFRAGVPNWRCDNNDEDVLRKYKRAFFVEWRTADIHKRAIWDDVDLLLDTVESVEEPRAITGEALRAGLAAAVGQPFRVVPYFDPGTWGGQWMREVCGLDDEAPNYAWCFDCVPEENSLLLDAGGVTVEIPAMDLVMTHPRELLGEKTFSRFGPEFPIRFDLLDTMGGGNLSLQVHPLTGYIQEHFGMHYTQDESYYILDADPDAVVYLGTRTGVDRTAMFDDLRRAEQGGFSFPAEDYVNTFPARKHDHFPIPAGTVHCSGANSLVLEISATPYIFTFKMWDWDRLGLDGLPRPISLDHAEANVQWSRDTEWVTANLVDQVEPLAEGDGWREERTGLHELEFIEVRRTWVSGTRTMDTHGTVRVCHLVEGAEAIIESPSGAFEPFVVHYAETFIIPADVGAYTVRPHGQAEGSEVAIVTASVRGSERD